MKVKYNRTHDEVGERHVKKFHFQIKMQQLLMMIRLRPEKCKLLTLLNDSKWNHLKQRQIGHINGKCTPPRQLKLTVDSGDSVMFLLLLKFYGWHWNMLRSDTICNKYIYCNWHRWQDSYCIFIVWSDHERKLSNCI